jgi:hypothetical protein
MVVREPRGRRVQFAPHAVIRACATLGTAVVVLCWLTTTMEQFQDIGTGASLIYPLIGASAYGWSFIATECDEESAGSAARILNDNMSNGQGTVPLSGIEIRRQGDPGSILSGGVLREAEDVDFTMCNPPFYESERAFREANARKIDQLVANVRKRAGPGKVSSNSDGRVENKGKKSALTGSNNFGGGASELWCPGGEVSFVQRLAQESAAHSQQCLWFSSLVSQVPLPSTPISPPPCIFHLPSCVPNTLLPPGSILRTLLGGVVASMIDFHTHSFSRRRCLSLPNLGFRV